MSQREPGKKVNLGRKLESEVDTRNIPGGNYPNPLWTIDPRTILVNQIGLMNVLLMRILVVMTMNVKTLMVDTDAYVKMATWKMMMLPLVTVSGIVPSGYIDTVGLL